MVRLVRKSLSFASFVAPIALALAGPACNSPASPAPSAEVAASSSAPAPAGKLRIVEAPASGSVDAVVRDALAGARAESRTLVVYVGATWCEPCQAFHRAAARGDLDAAFPHMTLLAFDLDRDRERLASAGYVSKYIPLFALPGPDGAASGKQIEGGIKGDGVIGYLSGRLTAMLSE
jgi:thiol-disulfide isomerase/thioredoxin